MPSSSSAVKAGAFPLAMQAAFEQACPHIPWAARNSREDWREASALFETAWLAATRAERERCCGVVFGMCSSDNTAQRTVDAIRGAGPHGRRKEPATDPASPGEPCERFWVLELRPAFDPHPAFPPTFRAVPPDPESSRTQDLALAWRLPSRAAAEHAARHMLGTLSCVWTAAEFVVTPNGPARAAEEPKP